MNPQSGSRVSAPLQDQVERRLRRPPPVARSRPPRTRRRAVTRLSGRRARDGRDDPLGLLGWELTAETGLLDATRRPSTGARRRRSAAVTRTRCFASTKYRRRSRLPTQVEQPLGASSARPGARTDVPILAPAMPEA